MARAQRGHPGRRGTRDRPAAHPPRHPPDFSRAPRLQKPRRRAPSPGAAREAAGAGNETGRRGGERGPEARSVEAARAAAASRRRSRPALPRLRAGGTRGPHRRLPPLSPSSGPRRRRRPSRLSWSAPPVGGDDPEGPAASGSSSPRRARSLRRLLLPARSPSPSTSSRPKSGLDLAAPSLGICLPRLRSEPLGRSQSLQGCARGGAPRRRRMASVGGRRGSRGSPAAGGRRRRSARIPGAGVPRTA